MHLLPFWVYVLYSLKDRGFYTGTTNNIFRRLAQHANGENKSTINRRPLILLYCEGHRSIIDARRREQYFKTTKGRTMFRMILRDSLDHLLKK